jgi:hypothetical protein
MSNLPGRAFSLACLLALAANLFAQSPSLPDSVSLIQERNEGKLTPKAQGARDTCSLFAIAAAAEFELAKESAGPHRRLSEEFLIWASKEACAKQHEQAMFYEAVHGLNSFGICSEDLMPYAEKDAAHKPSAAALADGKQRSARWSAQWIRRWNVSTPLSDNELRSIKEALAAGHPVACGLRWPKSLNRHEVLDVPAPEQVFDGHSIAFVGYEDDARKSGGGTFTFCNSVGPRWGNNGYGVMSYAYVRAYANDALWLKLGAPGSEVPIERFEAESLEVSNKDRCGVRSKEMLQWGSSMWSHGAHLLCGAQQGGFVELRCRVQTAGRYRLRVLATAAPDFGIVSVALDGKPFDQNFDLYSGRVCPAGSLELGTVDLPAGPLRLRFTAQSKNPASANFHFGLDTIDLLPVK